jgi:MFS family permease
LPEFFGARLSGVSPEGRAPWPGKLALPVLLGAFGSFGLFSGTFAVLLADLSRSLDLSPGPLGLALFAGAAASILAMATLGWTADRLGRRVFLVISGTMMGAGIAALAFISWPSCSTSSRHRWSARPRIRSSRGNHRGLRTA